LEVALTLRAYEGVEEAETQRDGGKLRDAKTERRSRSGKKNVVEASSRCEKTTGR
jgi:hypothetical protein